MRGKTELAAGFVPASVGQWRFALAGWEGEGKALSLPLHTYGAQGACGKTWLLPYNRTLANGNGSSKNAGIDAD
ncbi:MULTISPECIES: hypothetical protein [unclassified Mesorhizobium]|uniref:hypothetical protein n=1 Tax=unclassified Mesorhizobium TaxID=325217 RepID=UPI001CCEBCB6|nr:MULTISPECIES: hypothetical protein [unclassified Mesorhizobium]MBZ9738449.1 hypothetical protein [Mesorhizobium sp. CO1-1-4]MBZ9800807.1 hypothetical protein [Mesorhizobium sp. ES1-6]